MLRLLVWVVCDGTIVDESKYRPGSNKRRIQFKLSRPDKLEGLQALLTKMGVQYTFKPATMSPTNKLQPYYIRIYGETARLVFELLNSRKEFPEWFGGLELRRSLAVLQTLAETDGSWRWWKIAWSTTSKKDVLTIAEMCKTNGFEIVWREKEHGSGFKFDCKTQYLVRIGFGVTGKRTKNRDEWKRALFAA